MSRGIVIVGANGSGKTTLGRCLAGYLGYRHLDVEDYYFPRDSAVPYAQSRTREEVQKLMLADIKECSGFVVSSVNGDLGGEINARYRGIVYLDVPLEERMARVKQRAADKFGPRVLEGGDMYQQEQNFFRYVARRTMEQTDAWVAEMGLPVLPLDGRVPPEENAERIAEWVRTL